MAPKSVSHTEIARKTGRLTISEEHDIFNEWFQKQTHIFITITSIGTQADKLLRLAARKQPKK